MTVRLGVSPLLEPLTELLVLSLLTVVATSELLDGAQLSPSASAFLGCETLKANLFAADMPKPLSAIEAERDAYA